MPHHHTGVLKIQELTQPASVATAETNSRIATVRPSNGTAGRARRPVRLTPSRRIRSIGAVSSRSGATPNVSCTVSADRQTPRRNASMCRWRAGTRSARRLRCTVVAIAPGPHR
ncbi:hypothetical protein SAMN04489716_9201 [Actinoplanes derwentensis]|uniref:Uncharacterized protein n=1 Tax=Actinoplanes derwentensis TaxID=113562 RepID=A0A1H2DDV1_9ACTN|nr:hypothetical protein SAMN04489716_9201 [Actinoplanes derwentensis]